MTLFYPFKYCHRQGMHGGDSNGIVMQAINQTVTKAFHKECLFTFCRGVNEVDCIDSLMIAYE